MTDAPDNAAPASPDAQPIASVTRELPIRNKRGLHARASAKFVQMVERFKSNVTVTRGGETVGGNSIMGLMMLSAGIGTSIVVTATGDDAQATMDAIGELVGNRFNEDE